MCIYVISSKIWIQINKSTIFFSGSLPDMAIPNYPNMFNKIHIRSLSWPEYIFLNVYIFYYLTNTIISTALQWKFVSIFLISLCKWISIITQINPNKIVWVMFFHDRMLQVKIWLRVESRSPNFDVGSFHLWTDQ